MTIREMEIFLAVTEYGTMSKASENLFISQPTISGVIGKLESELGTNLFERLGKKLYITDAGVQLLAYTKQILNLHQELLQTVSINKAVRLKIGATISVGGKLLNQLLKHWQHPQPFVQVTNTYEIEQMLLNAQLDCAIIEGSVHAKELVCLPMFCDQLYLICSPTHPKFQEPTTTLSQLADECLILRERGSGTRETTLSILHDHNIPHTILWESNSIEAIFEAVRNNLGVTIASDKLLYEHDNLKKVLITDCDFSRVFQFVYHKDKYLSEPLRQFTTLCQQYADYQA